MKKAALFIHGFLTDNNDFDILPNIVNTYYDKLDCVLLPGHGEGTDIKDFTAESVLEFINNKYEELKNEYEIIDVFGYSMGGALAVYLASTRTIRNLVLFAPANKYIAYTSPIKWIKSYTTAIVDAKFNKIPSAAKSLSTLITDTKESYKIAINSITDFRFNSISNFIKIIKICNDSVKKINNPTYILWGNLDQLVPRESCEWLYFRCTNENSHFDIYENISHLILLAQDKSLIIKRVQKFLQNNDNDSVYDNSI